MVRQEAAYLECGVCGACGAGAGAEGEQPRGSMAWRRQPAALPAHPHAHTILVTYTYVLHAHRVSIRIRSSQLACT